MSTDDSTTVPTRPRRRLSMRWRWVITFVTTFLAAFALLAVLMVESAEAGGRHHGDRDDRGHHDRYDRDHKGHHGHKGGHDKPARPADVVEDHQDVTVVCATPLTDPATYVVTSRTWTTVTGWQWDKRERQWVPTEPVETDAQSSQRTVAASDAGDLVLPDGCTAPAPEPEPVPPTVPDEPTPPAVEPPVEPDAPEVSTPATPEPERVVSPGPSTERVAQNSRETPVAGQRIELAETGADGVWLLTLAALALGAAGAVVHLIGQSRRRKAVRR